MIYEASRHENWEEAGLMDFGEYAEKVEYVNQFEVGESLQGEWYYPDDESLTIYYGTFSDYHSPGASYYTYAEKFETKEEYENSVKTWESLPEYLEID